MRLPDENTNRPDSGNVHVAPTSAVLPSAQVRLHRAASLARLTYDPNRMCQDLREASLSPKPLLSPPLLKSPPRPLKHSGTHQTRWEPPHTFTVGQFRTPSLHLPLRSSFQHRFQVSPTSSRSRRLRLPRMNQIKKMFPVRLAVSLPPPLRRPKTTPRRPRRRERGLPTSKLIVLYPNQLANYRTLQEGIRRRMDCKR